MERIVGVVGLGRMGLPICTRLAGAGHRVFAGDVRDSLAQAAREAGARWLGDAVEVAAAADVLVTLLPGAPELRPAIGGALAALAPGSTWIDMTSASPAAARELWELADARGIACLDAPLGGGPREAAEGALRLFVGGSEETVAHNRALLEVLGAIEHVGGQGAGYTAKLLANLLWFGQAVAVGEALLLARRAGLDLDVLRAVLGRSAAASAFIERDLGALLDGDYLASFGLDRCCEELDATVAMAGELGVPCEISAAVADAHQRALERFGPVDGELLAVALLEERAGTLLRHRIAPA
jgi:3-hydroxyisobutyrate dehydrogenase-like beta-hydroxyacid dehydrogenase